LKPVYLGFTRAGETASTLKARTRREGGDMPQILVVATPNDTEQDVVYRERLTLSDFDSEHFSSQLAERVGWAVGDADRLEQSEEVEQRRPRTPE
jgi:hypothetical protein